MQNCSSEYQDINSVHVEVYPRDFKAIPNKVLSKKLQNSAYQLQKSATELSSTCKSHAHNPHQA
jgi:hypothetical protein